MWTIKNIFAGILIYRLFALVCQKRIIFAWIYQLFLYFCIKKNVSKEMETISLEQKRKVGFVSVNEHIIAEKKQSADLDEFLKGTISGEELVKYVCDRLDEKYGKNRPCGI
jgi:hypothetical protein